MITYVAFIICQDPDIAYSIDDMVAIGVTRDDAVSLVLDAWRNFATSHRLDPDTVHAEDVAVVAGVAGDVFINRIKVN
jgi:hypothetical protein